MQTCLSPELVRSTIAAEIARLRTHRDQVITTGLRTGIPVNDIVDSIGDRVVALYCALDDIDQD